MQLDRTSEVRMKVVRLHRYDSKVYPPQAHYTPKVVGSLYRLDSSHCLFASLTLLDQSKLIGAKNNGALRPGLALPASAGSLHYGYEVTPIPQRWQDKFPCIIGLDDNGASLTSCLASAWSLAHPKLCLPSPLKLSCLCSRTTPLSTHQKHHRLDTRNSTKNGRNRGIRA